jgi:single-strand DNA-binding protein
MFNKIILVGNLTRAIEIRYTQGGMAIAKSAIATSRKFKSNTGEQKEEVCFVDITFFGRSAEVANQYLYKGTKILVEGRLQLEQWSDQNGQKRSKHSVVAETMQMLGSRDTTTNSQNEKSENLYPKNESISATAQAPISQTNNAIPKSQDIHSIDIDDEDPF